MSEAAFQIQKELNDSSMSEQGGNNNTASSSSGETEPADRSNEKKQAAAGKGDNLEDLFSTLKQQLTSSDWLKDNTADKWVHENPELAKNYMEAGKK